MNQKRKIPVIHIILSVGLSVSFALILGLVICNFVVLNKMDEGEKVLTMFQDQSHFSKLKQVDASKIIISFKEKRRYHARQFIFSTTMGNLNCQVSQNIYQKQIHEFETLLCWVSIVKSCEKQSKQKEPYFYTDTFPLMCVECF